MTFTCLLTELDPLPFQSKLKVLTSSTGQAYICHTRVAPTSAAFAYAKYVLKKRSRPLADVKEVCNRPGFCEYQKRVWHGQNTDLRHIMTCKWQTPKPDMHEKGALSVPWVLESMFGQVAN
jgi:hypothetical protein